MQLIILGSGVYRPRTLRYPSGLVLKMGGNPVVFDAGCGTFMRLIQAGIDYAQVEHIFITHLHIDHVSDILQYLWAYHLDRREDLYIYGPCGILEFIEKIRGLAKQFCTLPFNLIVKEVKGGEKVFLPFCEVKVADTLHSNELFSVAYRVEREGKVFGYSGDTDYLEELVDFFYLADLLVLECTTLSGQKVRGHLTPVECATIAEKAKVGKVILTHLDLNLREVEEEFSRFYSGKFFVARDLLHIEV
ncbi:MBL fold metallo-hydrolase [Candidatus Aerophobetes bacterium]|nr:MBL fold metallo-hydrolase [Candidatus Aerophobetes bacterium]